MKYFTMEELDYIAKELIENPSKETLKKLNEKYNGEEDRSNNLNWKEAPSNEISSQSIINNFNQKENTSIETIPSFNIPISESNNNLVPNTSNLTETNEIVVPVDNAKIEDTNNEVSGSLISNLSIQSPMPNNNSLNTFETPKIDSNSNINIIPSLELPKNDEFKPNNNQELINVNLWDNSNNEINTMMQTTDNFNVSIEQPSNNVSDSNMLFNQELNVENNPIPITESPKYEGPTMFGQFEQNFNNNNAA